MARRLLNDRRRYNPGVSWSMPDSKPRCNSGRRDSTTSVSQTPCQSRRRSPRERYAFQLGEVVISIENKANCVRVRRSRPAPCAAIGCRCGGSVTVGREHESGSPCLISLHGYLGGCSHLPVLSPFSDCEAAFASFCIGVTPGEKKAVKEPSCIHQGQFMPSCSQLVSCGCGCGFTLRREL